jgi:protein-tyrosine phosphatase
VHFLSLLVEDHELARWGDPAIVQRGSSAGVTIERHPIRDGSAPPTPSAMDAILSGLAAAREAGDAAVACMGGVGRAGTTAACALVAGGTSAEHAIARIRALRHPTAVETAGQVAFVQGYERHVAAHERASRRVSP